MTIEARLETLERELVSSRQCIRRLWAGIALAIVSCVGIGATKPESQETAKLIRAERFELVDTNGRTRVVTAVIDNVSGMTLYSEKGQKTASLIQGKDGSVLAMSDENNKMRVGLSSNKAGTVLGLFDENGKMRVQMGIGKDGAGMMLHDESGKAIWRAP